MKRVLFVCTGNAGRSQIAEALFARAAGDEASVCSAGVAPWDDLHPVAVRLLRERGIDMRDRRPKHVRGFVSTPLDWVILIGDRAQAEAPAFSAHPVVIRWDIADPADADGTGREEAAFRATIAAIEARLPDLLDAVRQGGRAAPSA